MEQPKSTKKLKKSKLRLLMSILICSGTALILFLVVVFAGRVHGVEICPTDLSMRSFTYYELPILKKQLTSVSHSDEFSSMSDFVISNNYLTLAKAPKTWHLVRDNRTPPDSEYCDARILVDYLNQMGPSYGFVWASWSDNYHLHAQAFWPLVSQLAEDELYVDIPRLFEFSRRPIAIADFKVRLHEMAADIYLRRGKQLQQFDDHERAVEYFRRAMKLGSDPPTTKLLIEASAAKLVDASDTIEDPAAE